MLKVFTIDRIDNCFTMKEMCRIFLLKFMNVQIKLFFKNTLGNKKFVQSPRQKKTSELLQLIYN